MSPGGSLGDDLVAAGESPRARDVDDVRVAPDAVRKTIERRRQSHDADGRLVEELVARRALDLDRLDLAVGLDRHREQERAVDLPGTGLGRIVEVADALHLLSPTVDIGREAVLLGARTDELALGPLLVRHVVAPDLRLEPCDLEALVAEAS